MRRFDLGYRRILTAGLQGQTSAMNREMIVWVNTASLVMSVFNLTYIPVLWMLLGDGIPVVVCSSLDALYFILPIWLNSRNQHLAAAVSFYFLLGLSTFYLSLILGSDWSIQAALLLLMGSILFSSKRVKYVSILFVAALLILLEIATFKGFVKPVRVAFANEVILKLYTFCITIDSVFLFYTLIRGTRRVVESNLRDALSMNNKKSQFIQYVSHEIKGQFSGMHFLLEVLMKGDESDETKRKEMLGTLWSGCQHLNFVLSNLLEFSKFESGAAETVVSQPTDVRSLLTTILHLSRYAAAEKDIKVLPLLSDAIPDSIECDPVKLSQIVFNLLHNAIKFSGPGTLIFVELDREDDRWRLAVTDQGKGIPPEKMAPIFAPFFSENEHGAPAGLGLGLHICQRLVAAMGGEITVDSQPGKGSVFSVYWPVREHTGSSIHNPSNRHHAKETFNSR